MVSPLLLASASLQLLLATDLDDVRLSSRNEVPLQADMLPPMRGSERDAMSDELREKCPECGKARGGVCGACHCAPPHRGNHWYLFEAAQRSFCVLHCRDGWHHAICRRMAEEIGEQTSAEKREEAPEETRDE